MRIDGPVLTVTSDPSSSEPAAALVQLHDGSVLRYCIGWRRGRAARLGSPPEPVPTSRCNTRRCPAVSWCGADPVLSSLTIVLMMQRAHVNASGVAHAF